MAGRPDGAARRHPCEESRPRHTGRFCHHRLPHYFPYGPTSKMFVSKPHDLVLCWWKGLRSRGRNAPPWDTQPFPCTEASGDQSATLGPSCLGVNRQLGGFVLTAVTNPDSQENSGRCPQWKYGRGDRAQQLNSEENYVSAAPEGLQVAQALHQVPARTPGATCSESPPAPAAPR